ncbi:CobW/P47K family protein [Fibrobacter succinogenes subsp. succinogenes S85]|uniref:CobW/P47K family protein n=1 Tax=Fibrobacter succinogenes (strain ATCC 19169 / S85) TaxID=59374 RepID=C9RQF6_FIBSS|nr:GTP-binding protein [Fibrobacter succinogenes]ACX74792.1 cobalamin synthesis protein P47K [Fibrobacter succinogenes subsp. succinogenes S85]ADL25613.1 CobW/P47K family protein [Fibrobacter succinogenes subsp. succinogenes S85]
MKKNKKPVILITGYLGSGKTTLLNNILKQEKRKVALIVNDMGSINVDAEILKKNGSNVTECPMFELQNGCICCTLRDEFIQQIEKISNLDSIEVVFVEASGISDPGAVSASFLAYEDENPNTNVYLTSIVTVVDADRIYREFLSDLKLRKDEMFNDIELSQEEISTLIVDQIEFCNFIALNKCDLLSEDQLKEVESIVRDFQTRAPIIRSVNAEIDIDKIMTKKPFNYGQIDSSSAIQKAMESLKNPSRSSSGCVDEYGISSFVFEARKPFNRERFMEFVNNRYPTQLIRSKGYIWFSDCSRDVQLFEQAGRNSSVMPVSYWIDALQEDVKQSYIASNPELKENWDSRFGDRENQVVFIGRGYNKDEIMLELEKCLDERAIA